MNTTSKTSEKSSKKILYTQKKMNYIYIATYSNIYIIHSPKVSDKL